MTLTNQAIVDIVERCVLDPFLLFNVSFWTDCSEPWGGRNTSRDSLVEFVKTHSCPKMCWILGYSQPVMEGEALLAPPQWPVSPLAGRGSSQPAPISPQRSFHQVSPHLHGYLTPLSSQPMCPTGGEIDGVGAFYGCNLWLLNWLLLVLYGTHVFFFDCEVCYFTTTYLQMWLV